MQRWSANWGGSGSGKWNRQFTEYIVIHFLPLSVKVWQADMYEIDGAVGVGGRITINLQAGLVWMDAPPTTDLISLSPG